MNRRRTIIILIVLAIIFMGLWYTESLLVKYTETETITAEYWKNPEAMLDSDFMINLIYGDSLCDIDLWSYDNVKWNEYSSIDNLTILNHFSRSVVITEIKDESKRSRISEAVSKILYNSKKASNEELTVNDELYMVVGVTADVELKKIKSFIDTDFFIVVDGDLSGTTNFDKWHMRISGYTKDLDKEKRILRNYGIISTKSDKDGAIKILKMLSLVRIMLFWILVGALIYTAIKLAVDMTGTIIYKKDV